jgi:hypothetical protein
MYTAAKDGQPMLSVTDDANIAKALMSGAYANVSSSKHCFEEAFKTLRNVHLKETLAELQVQLEEAGRRGDTELARELIGEIMATRKKQVD